MSETWVKVKGYDVCIDEAGRVLRAVKFDNNHNGIPAAPYRWHKPYQMWIKATGVKITTLRAGMSRGTYQIK